MRGKTKYLDKLPSFKQFEDKVYHTLNTNAIDKIVFDIRFNGGGSSNQGTKFIEKLSVYLNSHPEVKVYVIIGRNTFSSAIINAIDCKKMTNAVFVGEETGGKPNHFGEVKNMTLPSSNLNVSYSTKYFKLIDEDVNTITPDVYVDSSFRDFSKGVDPAFEWIKIN